MFRNAVRKREMPHKKDVIRILYEIEDFLNINLPKN